MRIAVRISDVPLKGEYADPEQGEIIIWLKREGDQLRQGEDLFEFESAKGVTVVPSPVGGTLVEIVSLVGFWFRADVVETDNGKKIYDPPFCWIETDAAGVQSQDFARSAESREIEVSVTPVIQEKPKKPKVSLEELRAMAANVAGKKEIADATEDSPVSRVRASGLARKIAKEHEIDLASVKGSGPAGLIMACDVNALIACEKSATVPVVETVIETPKEQVAEDEEPVLLEMPLLWRTIAKNMDEATRIPSVSPRPIQKVFNFIQLVAFYKRFHAVFPNALWFPVMTAMARVLSREEFIVFNSFIPVDASSSDSKMAEYRYMAARKRVHMGISYDRGERPKIDWVNKKISGERLRILVIRDAHAKTIEELMQEVDRLFANAAKKRFNFADVVGFTAIFNNIGAIGHHSGNSYLTRGVSTEINLGFVDLESGAGVLQIVFDHRLIDGAGTTPFLRAIHEELVERVLPELEVFLSTKK